MNVNNQLPGQYITTLIQKGLSRSCTSLSFFLKDEVELETLRYSDGKKDSIDPDYLSLNKEIILYSDIIGQLKGKCFFKLDRNEANLLFSKNFPLAEGATPDKEMFDGFLLEIDNIITASVITEFSNSLNVKAFGGVPNIVYLNDSNKNELLKMESPEAYCINFTCQYKMKDIAFSPVFLWLMSEEIEAYALLASKQA
jgi:hypothetical protein